MKYDRISSPYSTVVALAIVSLGGLFSILLSHHTFLLGVGMIAGGFLSIAFKKGAEVSDRKTWAQMRSTFWK